MLKRTLIALVILMALPGRHPQLSAEDNKRPIKLGLMTELTGTAAAIGLDCKTGFELARKELTVEDHLSGYALQFIYEDTQGLPAVGVSAFRKLLNFDKVDAVVLKRSAIGMAVSPIAKQAEIPLLGLVSPKPFTTENPYAFRFYPGSDAFGGRLAGLALKLKLQRIAIISLEDEWQVSLKEAFLARVEQGGSEVIFDETVEPSATDFISIVTRLKQLKPEAVLVNLAPGQTGTFVKQLYAAGMRPQILGNYYLKEPNEITAAGREAVEGAVMTDISVANKPNFLAAVARLDAKAQPNSTTYTCYTGLALVLQTLAREANVSGRHALYQALLRTNSITTPDGSVPVIEREIQYQLSNFQIRNGRLAPLDDM